MPPLRSCDKVREFLQQTPEEMLVWIGDNVTHSNVASQATSGVVSYFPVASNSTHTQIIPNIMAKKR